MCWRFGLTGLFVSRMLRTEGSLKRLAGLHQVRSFARVSEGDRSRHHTGPCWTGCAVCTAKLDSIQLLYVARTELYAARTELYGAQRELYGAQRELYVAQRELYVAQRELYVAQTELYAAQRELLGAHAERYGTVQELFLARTGL